MGNVIACFDKAGDVDQPIIIVAGFVAGEQAWSDARLEWKHETGTDDFHMSDLRDAEKDCALAALARVAQRAGLVAVATGVHTKAFNSARLGTNRPWVGNAHRLCCLNCVIGVSEWARERNAPPAEIVFDEDGKLYNETLKLYEFSANNDSLRAKFRIGEIKKSDRRQTRGIQLADALAHSLFAFNRERVANPSLPMGPDLTAVTKDIQGNWLFTKSVEVEHWSQDLATAAGELSA